jgi:hypothetical protein
MFALVPGLRPWRLVAALAVVAGLAALAVDERSAPEPRIVRVPAPVSVPAPVILPIVRQVQAPPAAPPAAPHRSESWIPAYGACTRPDQAAQDLIDTRVRAWVDRTTHDWLADDDPSVWYGCVDHGAIVVNVEADPAPVYGHHESRWWVLRITDRAIDVIASQRGPELGDPNAPLRQVEAIALVDLDGDGVLEPIIERYDGTLDVETTVSAERRGQLQVVGRHADYILGSETRDGRLAIEMEAGEWYCVGARGRWRAC